MFVSSPKNYVVIYGSHSSFFVPIWLPDDSEAIEVPDFWRSVRLQDGSHSAICHARLPESVILTPTDVTGAITGAHVWTDGKVATEDDWPAVIGSRVYYSYVAPFVFDGLAGYIILQRYIQPSGSGWIDWDNGSYGVVYISSGEAYAKMRRMYVNGGIAYKQYRQQPTLGDIVSDMEERCWNIGSAHYWRSQYDFNRPIYSTQSPWTVDGIKAYCASVVSSCFRWEEPKFVDSMPHLEKDTNPLSPTFGQQIKVDGGPGPIWAQSDSELSKGLALAYLNALEDFPVLNKNSLQNIASVYQVLYHFAFDREATMAVFDELARTQTPLTACGKPRIVSVELPEMEVYSDTIRMAESGWLGGRYVFSTTVMDGEEAWNYFFNLSQQWLGNRSDISKCHGKATVGNATFQCTFSAREKSHEGITNLFESAYKLGLEPNAYVLWDFIPYSFVIDWFLPIGDTLDAYTASSHYSPLYYEYLNSYADFSICYSVSYDVETALGPINVYARWYDLAPPEVDTSYVLLQNADWSVKSGCWRLVDAICLVL